MITGQITDEIEAVITVIVRGPHGHEFLAHVVIDTGFNGFLTLPKTVIIDLELEFAGASVAELGDGSSIETDTYEASVLFNGNEIGVRVLEAEGGYLVGMSLLYGYRLIMDILEGGAVTITPLRELAIST